MSLAGAVSSAQGAKSKNLITTKIEEEVSLQSGIKGSPEKDSGDLMVSKHLGLLDTRSK